ncbi:MAG TPA: MXAN_2562 family outer membrane beta-barrel protein [Polyangiaceae bacterium]
MKRFVALLALGLWGIGRAASAQTVDEFGSYGTQSKDHGESPQYGAFEIRFGRYVPDVDSSVPHGTPFKDTFGDGNRYMLGLEGDWQLLRIPHLGTFGPGLGWGYTTASGLAHLSSDPSVLSGEQTSLSVMPFYLVGVLRADVLARDYGVPIVPYGKLGVGYALWWASDGGTTANVNGVSGRGVSYGPQYALGLMFLLDVLDEQTARDADTSIGINNSYIFGELFGSELDGFGSKTRMNVGTNSWVLGLAIEF